MKKRCSLHAFKTDEQAVVVEGHEGGDGAASSEMQ